MLVRGMINDQLGDNAQTAAVRFFETMLEIVEVAVDRIDRAIVGDVVTVVAQRRWIKRQQPQSGNAEVLEVVELFDQAGKVADAVAVAVHEGADVDFIKDGVLVPLGVVVERDDFLIAFFAAHGAHLS